jgi:hydrogenase-4 component J
MNKSRRDARVNVGQTVSLPGARIAVYGLERKFVNRREDIPDGARQVVYYALAVGHHVGVMDCFSSLAEIPVEEYQAWLESLPPGPGRSKLEGALKWGEIEINHSHTSLLLPLLPAEQSPTDWKSILADCLQCMQQEPAYYLMLRKLP